MQGPSLSIYDLRKELDLTLEGFAALVGLTSKSRVSEIENGAPVSLKVALKIEEISAGRMDAAALNAEVAEARRGCDCLHTPVNTSDTECPSPGKVGDITADRVAA